MKKFKYRLEPLLKVREHLEKERQKALALALKDVLTKKQEIEKIKHNKLIAIEKHRDRLYNRFHVADLLVYSRYLVRLKHDNIAQREFLKVLEKKAETKRLELVQASKERKKYEKLKERMQVRFEKKTAGEELKETNETAVNSYRRKQMQGK